MLAMHPETVDMSKLDGSCTTVYTRVSPNNFRLALETALATIANKQAAKSWEELEKEAADRKAERDAKRKANKNAKKNAK